MRSHSEIVRVGLNVSFPSTPPNPWHQRRREVTSWPLVPGRAWGGCQYVLRSGKIPSFLILQGEADLESHKAALWLGLTSWRPGLLVRLASRRATWVNRPSLIFPISIVATPPFRVLRPKTLESSRAPCVPLHTGAVKKYQLCLPRWTQNPSTFYPGLLSITSHFPARSLISVLPPQGVGLPDRIQDV